MERDLLRSEILQTHLGNYYEFLSGNATNWVLISQELVRNFFHVLPEKLTEKATLFYLSSPQIDEFIYSNEPIFMQESTPKG